MASPGRDSMLEKGYFQDVETDSNPTQWQHARASKSKWNMDFFRPSFLKRTSCQRKQNLRRTAYLDGLRGFAAFLVYWHHHHLWARDATHGDKILDNGWGYDNQYYFVAFPGIRTFFNGGHFAVTVFFVISGYVLSAKPLSLIHAGDYLKLGDNLASALFRRYIRLHLPIMITTFLYMTSWHAFGLWTEDAIHQRNWRDEVWTWYCEFKNFSFVFRTGGELIFSYNFHLWSIPVEFRGSIIIYTALMAFSRCRKNMRLLGEVVLIIYFLYIADGWFGSLFVSGMLLYDLDMLAENDDLPGFFALLEPFKTPIYYVLFAVSMYLGGVPSPSADVQVLRETPGWYYLSFLKPQAVFDYKWFYLFWAATLLIASIPRISWLKSFFEHRFNQHLGRISFSFYMIHGPVLWIVGNRFYSATGYARETHTIGIPEWINAFPLSKAGPFGFDLAFWVPHLILLPLTLWLAELVTKTIDEPTVRFSAWLYKQVLPKPGK